MFVITSGVEIWHNLVPNWVKLSWVER